MRELKLWEIRIGDCEELRGNRRRRSKRRRKGGILQVNKGMVRITWTKSMTPLALPKIAIRSRILAFSQMKKKAKTLLKPKIGSKLCPNALPRSPCSVHWPVQSSAFV